MRIFKHLLAFVLVAVITSSLFSQSKNEGEEDLSYGGMEIPGYISVNASLTTGSIKGKYALNTFVLNGQANDYMLPELDVEVGIIDRLSLEFNTGYRKIVSNATLTGPKGKRSLQVNKTSDGLNAIMLGANVGLLSEHKFRPAMYWQNQFYLPKTGHPNFQNEQLGYYSTLNMENTFSEVTYLDYSVGTGWDGNSPYPVLNLNLNPNFNASDYVTIYFDLGGNFSRGEAPVNLIDIGTTVTVSDLFSIDAMLGNQLQTNNFSKTVYAALKFTFDFKAFGK